MTLCVQTVPLVMLVALGRPTQKKPRNRLLKLLASSVASVLSPLLLLWCNATISSGNHLVFGFENSWHISESATLIGDPSNSVSHWDEGTEHTDESCGWALSSASPSDPLRLFFLLPEQTHRPLPLLVPAQRDRPVHALPAEIRRPAGGLPEGLRGGHAEGLQEAGGSRGEGIMNLTGGWHVLRLQLTLNSICAGGDDGGSAESHPRDEDHVCRQVRRDRSRWDAGSYCFNKATKDGRSLMLRLVLSGDRNFI